MPAAPDRRHRSATYAWWLIGMVLAAIYFVNVHRSFAGKVSAESGSHG